MKSHYPESEQGPVYVILSFLPEGSTQSSSGCPPLGRAGREPGAQQQSAMIALLEQIRMTHKLLPATQKNRRQEIISEWHFPARAEQPPSIPPTPEGAPTLPLALLWVGLVGAAPDASPFGWFMRNHSLSPRGTGLCRMETLSLQTQDRRTGTVGRAARAAGSCRVKVWAASALGSGLGACWLVSDS